MTTNLAVKANVVPQANTLSAKRGRSYNVREFFES